MKSLASAVKRLPHHHVHIRYRWVLPLLAAGTVICIYFGVEEIGKVVGGLAVESLLHHVVAFGSAAAAAE